MADPKESMLDLALAKNLTTKKPKPETGSGGWGGPQGGSTQGPTVNGYSRPQVVSALQKAIRRNKEPQALYWCSELLQSNESYRMWRRLITIAAEDVGLADPSVLQLVMACKQASEISREWNIPFLAVMVLCRAPKNREADDAAWLYEVKRKEGWKIPMPPEAVDGHTPEGKSRLYRIAKETGESSAQVWNREFYYDAALLVNYRPNPDGDRYRRKMMEHFGLPFDTYDLATCSQPRILTGEARKADEERMLEQKMDRVPSNVNVKRLDLATGERSDDPDLFAVESFTEDGLWYQVHLGVPSCNCPDWMRTAERTHGTPECKHTLAVRQWVVENRGQPDRADVPDPKAAVAEIRAGLEGRPQPVDDSVEKGDE